MNVVTTNPKNLATKNTTDFTVTESGDAFISQRKAAELLNINSGTFMAYLSRKHPKTNNSKGLSANILQTASTYFAYESKAKTSEAKEVCTKLMEAGAKAYIYHEAGYLLKAVPTIPQNFSEALRLAADLQDKNVMLEEQKKIDAPKVKLAEILTKSSNTRCVRVWVKGMKSDYGLRVGERDVFKWLREKKYIFKDRSLGNLPFSKYESNGLNYFSLAGYEDDKGVVRQSLQITGKGMVALTEKVINHFANKIEAA